MEASVAVKDDVSGSGAGPVVVEALAVHPPADQLPQSVEALLLTLDKPVTSARIAEALGLAPAATADGNDAPSPRRRKRAEADASQGVGRIESVIATLNEEYARTGRAFRIEAVAGGFRLMTLPAFAPLIAAFHKSRGAGRLSKAAVETLAIIAYKQPITRAHLEAIRGVACGEVLRSLMERRLVIIKGRAEELGRPILYGTSKEFLDAFGLATLKDLPTASELQIAL